MIILTLKEDEKIFIGDNVSVLVVEISGKQVKLGITAPPKVKILRGALDKLKGHG